MNLFLYITYISRLQQSDTATLVQVCALQQSPGFLVSTAIAWEDIINTDGDNEETWEKFDEHFTKLPGKRATGDLNTLGPLRPQWEPPIHDVC